MFNISNTIVYKISCMRDEINRLFLAAKKIKKLDTQAKVAKLLSITEQTLNNWTRRGIPSHRYMEIGEKIGCNPYWLRDGKGIMEMVLAIDEPERVVTCAMHAMEPEAKYYLAKSALLLLNQAHPIQKARRQTFKVMAPNNVIRLCVQLKFDFNDKGEK